MIDIATDRMTITFKIM